MNGRTDRRKFLQQSAIAAALTVVADSLGMARAYADDKARANRKAWRIPEANLHLAALCGGWPGALAAQHLLRHKNRKHAFQVVFWATVVLNIGALVLWKTVVTP